MTNWPQIVEQHGPLVWRTAQRLLVNEADTADCFQQAFVSAMQVARNETVRHWPALLRRLATARAIECLRARVRDRNRHDAAPVAETVDRNAAIPDQSAEANELAQHLRGALAKIDQRQAEVFCLACLEGLSYDEIAEQLEITANHVGVLLSRAKASLRDRLRAHAPQNTATKSDIKP